MTARFTEARIHRLVRNERGRLSTWPADRDLPPGWAPTGIRGSYEECIRQIELQSAAAARRKTPP
jgi:MbtH protein